MPSSLPRSARFAASILPATLLAVALSSGCRSVDYDAPAREALARAELEPSVATYQAFLDTRPSRGLFADQIEQAEAIVSEAERVRLLALELPEQVEYLRDRDHLFARSEVLTSALAHAQALPRIEQIQWALELVGPCKTDTEINMSTVRSMLAPPEGLTRRIQTPELGPAGMTGLERANYAAQLPEELPFEAEEREMVIAYLLDISTDTTPLKRVPYLTWGGAPTGPGTPTTPRAEAIRALDKIVGPSEMPGLAAMTGTLTGERAWSIVDVWLRPENKYVRRSALYPEILQIQGRGAEKYALELAELQAGSRRLPALLEAVWRRLPHVQGRIPIWLNSDSWEDQTAAAYALALNGWDRDGLEARLTELEGSDRRLVRSAVALAQSGLALESPGASKSAAALEASYGGAGAASSERFLELSARGFLKSTDTSYVDLSQPLPDLDLSETSPLRVSLAPTTPNGVPARGPYDTRKEALAALNTHYRLLQHAQSPKAGTLAIRRSYDGTTDDSVVDCVVTVAVLEREPGLLLDPEVEGRWLRWPDIYYCFLDTESDVVLGTYSGLFEDRLLPVPPDVDRAAREIFAVTGIHEKYSGAEGGLILVIPPNFLEVRGQYPSYFLKEKRILLRDLLSSIRGRTLKLWETNWLYLRNTPKGPMPSDPSDSANLIHTMAAGIADADFPTELVFAPSDGVVTSVETEFKPKPGPWPEEKAYLHMVITGSEGPVDFGGLAIASVEVGATVKRGQWIGFRRCE